MTEDGEVNEKVCASCGAFLEIDAESCIICGTPVEESVHVQEGIDISDEKECPGCGSFLSAGDSECFICGHSFDDDGATMDPGTDRERPEPAAPPPGIPEPVPPVDEPTEPVPPVDEPTEPVPDAPQPKQGAEQSEDWDMGIIGGENGDAVDINDDLDGIPDLDEPAAAETGETEIEEIEDVEPVGVAPEIGPGEFACPSCNNPVSQGTDKCPNCWTELSELVACPSCGEMVSSEADTCSKCFASLGLAVAAVDAPSDAEPVSGPDDDLDPDLSISEDEDYYEDYEEDYYEEELIEEYGLECPFCQSIERPDTDICTECGMPIIEPEDGEPPFKKRDWTPRKIDEADYQKKIAVILVFVLLVSALMPFLFSLPQVDRERVRIDGSFGDWDPIANNTDMIEGLNPNVDIVNFKIVNDAFNLYFFMEVEDEAFGDSEGNTARIFIDRDQDENTGYSIEGIGADYMVRVFGHDGQVTSSSCNRFDNTNYSSNDFNGFESFCPSVPHAAENNNDTSKFEVRIALDDLVDEFGNPMNVTTPVTAVFYMADTQGDYDFSDYPVTNRGGLLYVEQSSLVPANGIINLTSATPVLNLDLMAIGEDVSISNINLANNPDHSLSTTPTSIATGNVTSVTVNINALAYGDQSFVNTGFTTTDFTTDVDVVVRGQGSFGYVNTAPPLIEIDGAFADWAGKGVDNWDATGDATEKNLVDPISNADLDLNNTKAANENNFLNIYVNVEGQMMAGMWIPEKEERYSGNIETEEGATRADDVPDYTYSEPQVEQTRAIDLVRPAKETPATTGYEPRTGEDAVMIYLDTDGNAGTGYATGDIGADRLMVIYGIDGTVTDTEFLTYDLSPTDPNYGIIGGWDLSTSYVPEAAASGSSLEARLDLNAFTSLEASTNASAFIRVVNWDDSGDSSGLPVEDVFDVTKRRGTRTGIPPVPFSGRVFQSDGVTLAQDFTVVGVNLDTGLRVTAFTNGNTDPTYTNYRIYMPGSENDNITLFASNGTHNGTLTTVYQEGETNADLILSDPVASYYPYSLVPTNLGIPTGTPWQIQLDWQFDTTPDNVYVRRGIMSPIDPELGTYGKYYGSSPIAYKSYGAGAPDSIMAADSVTDPAPYFNTTNYYLVEANSGPDMLYSMESPGILADFWAANFTHTNITSWSASLVPVDVTMSDGVGNVNGTVHYRKNGTAQWYSRELEWQSGSNFTGADYRAWIPVDYSNGPTNYDYYIYYSDGTFDSLWGGPAQPVTFTADAPPDDPYPVFGYVKWGDGTIVGAGVDVWIEWVNTTGEVVNHPTDYPYTTASDSAYSVDVMDYDSNTIIWGNATVNIGGVDYYGYNQTQVVIPQSGGYWMDIILEAPALNLTKTAPTNALAGDVIMYTLVVTNIGNSTAYNINVTEEYSPWVNFTDASPMPDFGDNVWNGSIPDLAPGETFAIYINVTIDSSAPLGTEVINNATVELTGFAGMVFPGDNATATTMIGAAILNITKWAPAVANTGELITYWLNYSNDGTQPASNVVIIETYPAGVTFMNATPPASIGDNIWQIGLLPAGASNSIEITVQVNPATLPGTVLNNTVVISGYDEAGAYPLANDTAWAETLVIDPLMTITKTGPALVRTGETFMYTLTYQNIGNDTAYNVIIIETYPAGVTFTDSSIVPDNPGTGNDTWTFGLVPGLSSGVLFINVTVDNNMAIGAVLMNTVVLGYENNAGIAQPQLVDSSVTTIVGPTLTVDKHAVDVSQMVQISEVDEGDGFNYLIIVNNTGNDWAYNVTVNDTIPFGLEVTGGTTPSYVNGTTYYWNISQISPGGTEIILISVLGNESVDWANNTVYVDYENLAGLALPQVSDFVNITIIHPVIVVTQPDVVITKTAPSQATAGSMITYTIFYENIGDATAYNVRVFETYPPEVSFLNATPSPTNIGFNTWDVGNLAPGENGTISVTVYIFSYIANNTLVTNWVDVIYEDNATQIYTASDSADTLVTALIIPNTPPTIVPESPEFVYAGDNITIVGIVNDIEDYTIVQTVMIYYTDIFGEEYSAPMQPSSPHNATTGDGWYAYEIPYQIWKGVVSFFIWAEDNMSASSSTGVYDVDVLIPPYYVWGHVSYEDGDPVRDAVLRLTNLETSETVIAIGDSSGNYIVDLGTLYSGYMNGEEIEIFGTDGSYYGYSFVFVQTDLYDDPGMDWPNIEANILLNFIPEFSTLFVPLMLTLSLFMVYRRTQKKRRGDDTEN